MPTETAEMEMVFEHRGAMYDRDMDLNKLAADMVRLADFPKDGSATEFNNIVKEALRLLNSFETSALLGKAVAKSAELDKKSFLAVERKLQKKIDTARKEIAGLRKSLGESNLTAQRRRQYNVLAKKIASLQTVEVSTAQKERICEEIAQLEHQMNEIEERKHRARCEFRLLLHSVDELEALTKEVDFTAVPCSTQKGTEKKDIEMKEEVEVKGE